MRKRQFERMTILQKLYPYLKEGKRQFAALGVLKVYTLLVSLVTPILYLLLINDVLVDRNLAQLPMILGGYIGVYLLQTLGIAFNKRTSNRLFLKFKLRLKGTILRIYTKMDTRTYESYNLGDLKNRIDDDLLACETFLSTHILDFIYAIVSALVIAAILLVMNPLLALTGFVMVPVSFWFTKFMGRKVHKLNEERRVIRGRCESFMFSCFANWKEIKANNLEEKHSEIFDDYRRQLNPLFVKNQVYWYINRTFVAFKDFFITRMNLYFIGGLLIIYGHLNIGVLLAFMNYYAQFFDNITKITDSMLGLKTDKPGIDLVLDILAVKSDEKSHVGDLSDAIEFKDVCFRYNDNQAMVLTGVNLSVRAGEHLAVVGRSGCGKTTLARLMMGLYEPSSGAVFIGAQDISRISFHSVSRKIGIVLQDPPLFNLTIRENLQFAGRHVGEDALITACRKASIYDFVDGLPDRFDTVIGERGIKLSGGQKQRLAIARVFLQNPDIVIFDEATSSLDSDNEKAIVSAVKELAQDKTVITIAHRLSTVLGCDRVAVMDRGKIVAVGRHEELRGASDVYDLLFDSQYRKS